MRVVVNTSSLPVYKKFRIASLLCIFETSVDDNGGYDIRVKGQGKQYLKPVLQLEILRTSLSFLMEGVHIYHNDCLLCVGCRYDLY